MPALETFVSAAYSIFSSSSSSMNADERSGAFIVSNISSRRQQNTKSGGADRQGTKCGKEGERRKEKEEGRGERGISHITGKYITS